MFDKHFKSAKTSDGAVSVQSQHARWVDGIFGAGNVSRNTWALNHVGNAQNPGMWSYMMDQFRRDRFR